ncbi:hypothetical protein SHKM778_52370 [Streptomyces sp. KM77-8]|uniref:Tetratricopeptide repeat protein n=1 Tax=Streptomyces haneummycinicus TaxID=3074435 RepID=A0AAT9HMS6_9ACTN
MDDYYDLGDHRRPVTTASAEAQLWFDRGLIWTYAFNHEEAVACFERAAEADPDCAMAYWGIAYALGPNYNKPWEAFDGDELAHTVARTHTAVERAHDRAAHATPSSGPSSRPCAPATRRRGPPRTARCGTSPTRTGCSRCTRTPPATRTWPPSAPTP